MRMKRMIITMGVMMMFLTSFAQYQKMDDVDVWVKKINEQTTGISSLQAHFTQEKVISFLEEAVVSKGEFWFQQPDKIRWEYQDPYHYTMIMDGGMLNVKDGSDEYSTDLSSNKMFEQMNGLISGSISGDLLRQDDDYTKEYFQNKESLIIRFIPKSEDLSAYLQYIEIWFNRANLQVDKLLMQEPSGDYTSILFSERKINQVIGSDVFQ